MATSSSLLPVLLLLAAAAAGSSSPCQLSCGGVDIPYPFGIGDKSCFREGFEIECRNRGSTGDVPVLPVPDDTTDKAIRVLDLSVAPLPEALVLLPVAWQCFDLAGKRTGIYPGDVNFNQQGVYRISNTRNELYVLGCNTMVYAQCTKIEGSRFDYAYYAGCVSAVNDANDPKDGACAGLGCCHVEIPPGLTDTTMSMWSDGIWSHTNQSFCPCDYAFIVERGKYTFRPSHLLQSSKTRPMDKDSTMPLVLDWAIRGNTSISCPQAEATNHVHEYACRSSHSSCVNATNGPGYFCNCIRGYEGNPYVFDGCQSENCKDRRVGPWEHTKKAAQSMFYDPFTNDPQDGACAGLGCCHVEIPPGLTDTTMSMLSDNGIWSHANQSFCPCDYAFIVEQSNYTLRASHLLQSSKNRPLEKDSTMPLVLDWAIRGNTSISCAQAAATKHVDEYACRSSHSSCINATNGPGYFCNCTKGYEGNPYVVDGCQSKYSLFHPKIV